MTKYKKVKTALQICRWMYEDYEGYFPEYIYGWPNRGERVCINCPYEKIAEENEGYDSCLEELHKDALDLLKRAGCFLEEGLQYTACGRKLITDEAD